MKVSCHLKSAQLRVKKIWKAPRFSSFAISSYFFFSQNLGVPGTLSRTEKGSSSE